MAIKSASMLLLKPTDKLTIKFTVGLLDGNNKDSFYSIYDSGMAEYLTLNASANIVFQYKTEAPWNPNQLLHVNDGNIYRFNMILQEFYKIMLKPDLFIYYKDGTIECQSTKKDIMTMSLRGNEFLELEPAVVFNSNGTPIPGVLFRINEKAHQVDLSIDEYEAIMYKFSKIDISQMTLQLINTRLLLEERINESKKALRENYKPEVYKGNIFEKKVEEQKETVIDNRSVEYQSIMSLDDM